MVAFYKPATFNFRVPVFVRPNIKRSRRNFIYQGNGKPQSREVFTFNVALAIDTIDSRPLDILRRVENRSAIKPKQAKLEVELLKNGPAQLVAGKVTFRQLAQYAKDNIYVSAVTTFRRRK